MANWKKSMMASAGIGGGGFIFFSNYNVNNTNGNGYDWFVYPAQATVFTSTGDMYTIWKSYVSSSTAFLHMAKLDADGQIVNSKTLNGYQRGQTYHRIPDAYDQGSFITIDSNDNPYIGWGAGSGGYVASLSQDLSTINWDEVLYGFAQYCCGGVIDPQTGNLIVKSPDANNITYALNGSTGAFLGVHRDTFSSPGIQVDPDRCNAAFLGYGRIAYVARDASTNRNPLMIVKQANSTGTPSVQRLNSYGGSQSWEYPTAIGSEWKPGDPYNNYYKMVITGRGVRSGTQVFYITEVDWASGQQTNNLYYNTSNSAGITYATAGCIDSNGNTYVIFSNNGAKGLDIVKFDSSYNVSQAIRLQPASGSNNTYAAGIQYNIPQLSSDENFLCISNGVYDVDVGYQNRAFMAMKIPTDLTSAVGGPHNIPLGGGWTGDQFEIIDVTSTHSSGVYTTEVSPLVGGSGSASLTLSTSTYATAPTLYSLATTTGTVTIP